MMKHGLLLLAILAVAMGIIFRFQNRYKTESAERSSEEIAEEEVQASLEPNPPQPEKAELEKAEPMKPVKPAMVAPAEHLPRKPIVMADVVTIADRLNEADASVEDDLQIVGELLQAYTRFIGTGPEGGLNEEIVACLRGKNPKRITLIGPDNAKLNEAGELLDRFGTPYYFHPISADDIEVRSAGPDQKLWSNDDVLLD